MYLVILLVTIVVHCYDDTFYPHTIVDRYVVVVFVVILEADFCTQTVACDDVPVVTHQYCSDVWV
jgi:hypothetical protein